MTKKPNMITQSEFNKWWPFARDKKGWRINEEGFVVAPRSHHTHSWSADYTPLVYEKRIIYVPHWFLSEIIKY